MGIFVERFEVEDGVRKEFVDLGVIVLEEMVDFVVWEDVVFGFFGFGDMVGCLGGFCRLLFDVVIVSGIIFDGFLVNLLLYWERDCLLEIFGGLDKDVDFDFGEDVILDLFILIGNWLFWCDGICGVLVFLFDLFFVFVLVIFLMIFILIFWVRNFLICLVIIWFVLFLVRVLLDSWFWIVGSCKIFLGG